MAERSFSDDELRLYELLQQLLCLSDNKEHAGTIILLGPNGSIVGDVVLSAADIEAATDALLHLNVRRSDASDPTGGPLPIDDVSDADIADEIADVMAGLDAELAALLNPEGGQS